MLAVAAGLAVARWLWLSFTGTPADAGFPYVDLLGPNRHMVPGLLVLPIWLAALRVQGLYEPLRMVSSLRIADGLVRATMSVLVAVVLVQYFASHRTWSRLLLVSFVAASSLLLLTWRLVFFRLQSGIGGLLARQGVVIIGVGEDAQLLSERLARHGAHAYAVLGHVAPAASEPAVVKGTALGGMADLRAILERTPVGLVILASRQVSREEAMDVATLCARHGLDVLQVPFTWGIASARVESAAIGELDLVKLGGLGYPPAAVAAKRAVDVLAVLAGGALIAPLLLLVAALVKLDGGPVFYVSERAGKGGKPFPFVKFRTMVPDADQRRDTLVNEADGRLFKLTDDPRITPIGRSLRRWSIDELPQIWNVLIGDMNLVGPRPLPMADLVGIENDPEHRYWFEQRSRVSPGITGLWQVSGRSELAFRRMVELDVYYIQHWSLLLDLQILLSTLPAVLRGRGAR